MGKMTQGAPDDIIISMAVQLLAEFTGGRE
jgi:hypothetical protein